VERSSRPTATKGATSIVAHDFEQAMDADQSNGRQRVDADEAASPEEKLFVRSAGGVHVSYDGSTMAKRLKVAGPAHNQGTSEAGGPVVIRQSGALVPDSTPYLVKMLVPGLIAFGRGGPDEPRAVRVSKLECLRHYALLSLRHFAQDNVYTLMAFDMSARYQAMAQASLYCRLSNTEQNAATANVTPQELSALLGVFERGSRQPPAAVNADRRGKCQDAHQPGSSGGGAWERVKSSSAGASPPRLLTADALR